VAAKVVEVKGMLVGWKTMGHRACRGAMVGCDAAAPGGYPGQIDGPEPDAGSEEMRVHVSTRRSRQCWC
jgi:hypothetical protein